MASVPYCEDFFGQQQKGSENIHSHPQTVMEEHGNDFFKKEKIYELAPDLRMYVKEKGSLYHGSENAPSEIRIQLLFMIPTPYDVSQLILQKDRHRSLNIPDSQVLGMVARMGLERAFQKTRRILGQPRLEISYKSSTKIFSYNNQEGTYYIWIDVTQNPSDIHPTTILRESQALQEQMMLVLLENYGKNIWNRPISDILRGWGVSFSQRLQELDLELDQALEQQSLNNFESDPEKNGTPFIFKTPFGKIQGQVVKSVGPDVY